jgi:hypothetical protein
VTDLEKIRLKIGDKTVPYHFSDVELQAFLTDEGSINMAAAAALEAWATEYGFNADSEHIGDYSYTQKIIDNMLKLAASLKKADAEKPSITWAEPDLMFESDEE